MAVIKEDSFSLMSKLQTPAALNTEGLASEDKPVRGALRAAPSLHPEARGPGRRETFITATRSQNQRSLQVPAAATLVD